MPTAARTYINQTFIGDAQDPMFDPAGPQCWMQKQAAWIPGFWGANKDFRTDPSRVAQQAR